ncbi:MAG: carboxylating nicotinate-nucleotide diphosphorylase [Gammaproteobacteria bacterium]|nr:carboxylating nicotinate-nucleotide diphosphorylase [Gammaproteobacteria bacterium]
MSTKPLTPPPADIITQQVQQALAEDIGSGDVSVLLVPASEVVTATVICRDDAVISGRPWFDEVFQQIDQDIEINWQVQDGDHVNADTTLCQLTGNARHLLSGERSGLNFLQTLSATATQTHQLVKLLEGTQTRLLDTRKTLPGFRQAQKYAVRCGGGYNHRMGLYDMVLIKENHIIASGSISQAVTDARHHAPGIPVEVEVENLAELQQALDARVDRVLLDNMDTTMLRKAVEITAGTIPLEASGGIDLDSIRGIAETGVDYISVGSITKHIQAIDLSMRFVVK